jgi:tetratricopeptide (TPR) repeat protein
MIMTPANKAAACVLCGMLALSGKALATTEAPVDTADEAAMETNAPAPVEAGLLALSADAPADAVETAPVAPLSEEEIEARKKALFRTAYDAFRAERYEPAAHAFFEFMAQSNQDEEQYEWAQFFFGLSLEKMQLSHASIDVLSDLAKRKPSTRIVTYILEMFEAITRNQPFDRDLVLKQVLVEQDYQFSDPLIADFVHYHQGMEDWDNGLQDWALQHFQAIQPNSYYHLKYRFHQARYQVFRGEVKAAIQALEEILAQHATVVEESRKPAAQSIQRHSLQVQHLGRTRLIDDVRWMLARLLYEQGEYEQALTHYQRIETPVTEQATFLLEQAWNVYQKGDVQKAMGFLYAFEAPSFKRFFSPEFYLLKSLIYKDVCHYDSALSVVDAFQARYGQALNAIYQRRTVADPDSEEVLNMALTKEKIGRSWQFIQLLETEQKTLQTIQDGALRSYLDRIYTLQIEETARVLQLDLNMEFERIANDLLRYEEETNLMRYEIGIDMYQRVSNSHYQAHDDLPGESEPGKEALKKVVFPFQGEFWNEELAHYRVQLASRCDQFEEWDVFFK